MQNPSRYEYAKAGVMLDDLLPTEQKPLTLFGAIDPAQLGRVSAHGVNTKVFI